MTDQEKLKLAADASEWRDAADWKDNCGRLSRLLDEIPDIITELERLRSFAKMVGDYSPETGLFSYENQLHLVNEAKKALRRQ
jgi:hypothetical protein